MTTTPSSHGAVRCHVRFAEIKLPACLGRNARDSLALLGHRRLIHWSSRPWRNLGAILAGFVAVTPAAAIPCAQVGPRLRLVLSALEHSYALEPVLPWA